MEEEDVGERPDEQPAVLRTEPQVVDAAVELGELLQLPDGGRPHRPRQRHHEVRRGVDELRWMGRSFMI